MARTLLSRPAPVAFWPPDGPQGSEKPGQLRPTRCAQASANRERSNYRTPRPREGGSTSTNQRLTSSQLSKRAQHHRPAARTRPPAGHRPDPRRVSTHEPGACRAAARAARLKLERTWHDAAASLREGISETLTLIRLGIDGQLGPTPSIGPPLGPRSLPRSFEPQFPPVELKPDAGSPATDPPAARLRIHDAQSPASRSAALKVALTQLALETLGLRR